MRKRIGAAALLLALLLAACADPGGETEDGLRLWFSTPAGQQSWDVSPAMSSVPYEGAETIPALLEALLAGPAPDSGLVSPIPADTQVVRWAVDGRVAQVELSGPYAELTGLDRTISDYCVALTLCQLPGVDGVLLSAGGGGSRLLRAGDVIFSGAEEEPVDVTAALYFRRTGGDTLSFEWRVFRLTEDEAPAKAVLEALAAGPQDEGLSALLPPGLTVRSAWVDGGVCHADLSADLLQAVPERAEDQGLVISSIVETLCSLDKVEQVELLVEGQPLTAYGSLDLSRPLSPG